jgi:flagellar hook-associated protein 1 FlgK
MLQQKGIQVSGNNIANVNTPGYSRQRLLIETSPPLQTAYGNVGMGAAAEGIERVYDRFLGDQITSESQSLGRWQAQSGFLQRAEMTFDESAGYGINHALGEFWGAWQDLSNNPTGSNERAMLIATGEVLADNFQKFYADLYQTQLDIDVAVEGAISDINRLAAEIADLNLKVLQTEAGGHTANDFRDRRDLAVNELAELIDINTFESSDGQVTVSAADNRLLVENGTSYSLSTQINGYLRDIVWNDGNGNSVDITASISNGKLKGWLDARDENIGGYMTQLDELAVALRDSINAEHRLGYGLDGSTNRDFFAGTGAIDLAVNADIVADPNLIAAANGFDSVPGDKPGDNGNAIDIANLRSALTMSTNTVTFDDFFNGLVSEVGSDALQAGFNQSHQNEMVTYLNNYRDSVSGVSIDEEMINLVKFQTAYSAAAKLISTTDELLQTMLNMV